MDDEDAVWIDPELLMRRKPAGRPLPWGHLLAALFAYGLIMGFNVWLA